jgi:hypothetical protein
MPSFAGFASFEFGSPPWIMKFAITRWNDVPS